MNDYLFFFFARRARRGFIASVTFLILAGSSPTRIVASACDISSCGQAITQTHSLNGALKVPT